MISLPPEYPEALPVSAHRAEILAALRTHPVIVVCGDTGSGKTTQLPKMALELGDADRSPRIAVTQPRRLAAVTMAERVAAELNGEVGALVGYRHRYGRCVSDETRVTFMTDGVLLAETRNDPLLRRYDVILVDEVHERSLNIDFLLGILKRILARRRDLKVIVASATLDTAGFARFFGGAPVIEVPGRLYPIETRYRPPPDGEEADLARDVAAAVAELPAEDDVLVFLPGERDIRECAERLAGERPADEIIPLLASLPAAEQRRAFRLSSRRRIVLATNVAETSVTIPGIRAVVDSGLARISRYVHRTQVQRLQIEPVSQASARQRAGRCGRVGPGTCIRLYAEEDFLAREAFTPPEVLRSSLAGVLLTMLDLRLGDIATFPFLDPPRAGEIREGLNELLELGAVEADEKGDPRLTAVGAKLARLPVEPRFARILLAASELATLPSALPVVAALACDDPRRRPVDEREKAKAAHARFRVPGSDFLGTLKLWKWYADETKDLSQAKARKLCKATYLSYPKMREWRELTRQLGALAGRLGLDTANDNGGPDALHRALLTGLLGRIGRFDTEERDYRGARGLRFAIHPGSVLAKHAPPWLVAGELVDTARLFAREAATIDPRWIESAAGGLCRHSYHSPTWDGTSGYVRATEQVTLYGLVIVTARRCDYGRVDPAGARAIFIRFGLVGCDFPKAPPPVRANADLIGELRRRAEKLRRPELFDEAKLEAFFDGVIPEGICSADALRRWLRTADARARAAFALKREDWFAATDLGPADFPDALQVGGVKLRLSYANRPDDPETDGITCTVRRDEAAALRLWRADWLVPGALPGKLFWMLSVLPTALRKVLTPFDDTVSGLLAKLKPGSEPLADAVRRTVYAEWGFRIPEGAWERVKTPPHLRVRYRIVGEEGREIACSRDLEEALSKAGLSDVAPTVRGVDDRVSATWDFGPFPESVAGDHAGWKIEHYQALHDTGAGVVRRLYADRATAEAEHAAGVTRLFTLALKDKVRRPFAVRGLPFDAAVYLKELDYSDDQIAADILQGAVREALVRGQAPVRDAETFARRLAEGRADVERAQTEIAAVFTESLGAVAACVRTLETDTRLCAETRDAVQTQLAWLFFRGFPRTVPLGQLRHYRRYLKGAALRLQRAALSPSGDRSKEMRFAPYWTRYREALQDRSRNRLPGEVLSEIRWMLEEYRVSLFAQELKTPAPVSPRRLDAKFARFPA